MFEWLPKSKVKQAEITIPMIAQALRDHGIYAMETSLSLESQHYAKLLVTFVSSEDNTKLAQFRNYLHT